MRLGGSRAPRRPAGADFRRVAASETAPAVWQTLVGSHVSLSQLVLDRLQDRSDAASQRVESSADPNPDDEEDDHDDDNEDDDGNEAMRTEETEMMMEMVKEQIEALSVVRKKKSAFKERAAIFQQQADVYAECLSALNDLDEAGHKRDGQDGNGDDANEEEQVQEILTTAWTSTLAYLADCISRAGGPAKSVNKMQTDAEAEASLVINILSVLGSISDKCKSAHQAVKFSLLPLVKLLIGVAVCTNRNVEVRENAISAACTLIDTDPDLFSLPSIGAAIEPQLQEVMNILVDAVFTLCSEVDDHTGHSCDSSDDCEGYSGEAFGTGLLDVLLTNVAPTPQIAQVVLDRTIQWCSDKSVERRRAAAIVISVFSKSCRSFTESHASELWNEIEKLLQDTEEDVKGRAIVAGGQLVTFLPSAMQSFALKLYNEAWNILDNVTIRPLTKVRACIALVNIFSPELEDDEDDKKPDTKTEIVPAVVSPVTATSRVLFALTQLASAEHKEEEASSTWKLYEGLFSVLEALLEHEAAQSLWKEIVDTTFPLVDSREEDDTLRGPTRVLFNSLMSTLMTENEQTATKLIVMQGQALHELLMYELDIEDSELRSSAHQLLATLTPRMSATMGDELHLLLPTISRPFDEEYTAAGVEKGTNDVEEEEDEDDDEEEEDEAHDLLSTERASAVSLYRALIVALGSAMLPHHEAVWETVVKNVKDMDSSIQMETAATIAVLPKLWPEEERRSEATIEALHPNVKLLFMFIKYSHQPQVVAQAFGAMTSLVQECGASLLQDDHKMLISHIRRALKGDLIAQQGFTAGLSQYGIKVDMIETEEESNAENSDQAEEQAVADNEIQLDTDDGIGSAMVQLLIVLCISMQDEDSVKEMMHLILQICDAHPSALMYGSAAQLLSATFAISPPISASTWLPLLLDATEKRLETALEAQDIDAQRNTIYALGQILAITKRDQSPRCECVWSLAKRVIQQCQTSLNKVSGDEDKFDLLAARDNAVAAICKSALNSAIPGPSAVLPYLETILEALPIAEDAEEVASPAELLLYLEENCADAIMPYKAQIASVLQKMLDSSLLPLPPSLHEAVELVVKKYNVK